MSHCQFPQMKITGSALTTEECRKGSGNVKQNDFFLIGIECFAHLLFLRKQKESEFFIQKIEIARKWID